MVEKRKGSELKEVKREIEKKKKKRQGMYLGDIESFVTVRSN